jgi:hypothetical protein
MDLIEFLSTYWQIVVALAGIIYSYATLRLQNTEQERRIMILEQEAKDLNPVIIDIRTKLASIEATLLALIREEKKK